MKTHHIAEEFRMSPNPDKAGEPIVRRIRTYCGQKAIGPDRGPMRNIITGGPVNAVVGWSTVDCEMCQIMHPIIQQEREDVERTRDGIG